MIAAGEVDAIYIATPPGSHKELALKCATAKIPCYIEKPVATSFSEHQEMIEAFAATNTKAFAAYYRREHARFKKVKELVETGAIGKVCFAHLSLYRPVDPWEKDGTSWRIQPEMSGGGIFMDLGVHQLDIMNFIFGEFETEMMPFSANNGGFYQPEDTINVSYRYKNGVHLTADWCFVAGFHKDEIEIVGTDGRITLSCFGTDPVVLETLSGREVFEFERPEHVHQPLIQTIVDELNGEGNCPSTLETALATAWLADKLVK